MTTKLSKNVVREVEIPTLGPVIVTMQRNGVALRVPGSRKEVHINWVALALHCVTDTDVPAHLYDKPLELLRYESSH